ncbi:MAG TPA: enoyl-CoA hydratase, partial [Phycisphaerae bacterium]|nr:enoyl-CoA hydratase [Phycisphaerae bacterium]
MNATATIDAPSAKRHDAYENLLRRCQTLEPVITAIAYPCEETALTGPIEAAEARLIKPILVGPRQKIREVAKAAG